MSFELCCELEPAHEQDVKAVLAIDIGTIATASRDGGVGVWKRDSQKGAAFRLHALLGGHDAYVNSLAYVKSSRTGCALLASGGNSSLILLHSLVTMDPTAVEVLMGHSLNVCALHYGERSKRLLSGSWDRTARVWQEDEDGWRTSLVLDGHDQAVWGVVNVEEGSHDGCFLTGAADQLVILWDSNGNSISRFKGYPEPVRGLVVAHDGATFAVACNDGLVRVCDFTGSPVRVLEGHTDSVFSIQRHQMPKGDTLMTSGEDHSARLWNSNTGESIASLLHPCQTVWTVDALESGEIITGGSDGKIRLWSCDPAQWADETTRRHYSKQVLEGMTNYKNSTERPLTSHPMTVTIDVDVSDDAEPLKLCFKTDEDPQVIAVTFVESHGLPASYVDRITEFIRSHTSEI